MRLKTVYNIMNTYSELRVVLFHLKDLSGSKDTHMEALISERLSEFRDRPPETH